MITLESRLRLNNGLNWARMCDNFSAMEIDIQLLPSPPNPRPLLIESVVVIDVLRATSVIVQAMSQGALEILPSGQCRGGFSNG